MPAEGSSPPVTASDTLLTRTYVGLLAAQFLAAFNDQAIHASSMFFAINTQTLTESQAISLMPILFYAPWALFCTLAGFLADRFSKRNSLVAWKIAEVAITGIALFGFWLGTEGGSPSTGTWVVLSTVFLMGTHSAFFVPAKYGVMPEILPPHLLSRGNGLLESLSFLAVILGTVSGGVMSFVFLRRETNIGVVLLGLAIIGAIASMLIRKMPAANPHLKFPPYLYAPLWKNLKIMLTSRPLSFAVIGIAFFTFIVAFMRATVYMFGESQVPRWDELKTSAVVGTVALGVGLGSPLAGWLSGKKVELGLIPLGAAGMIAGCVMAAFSLNYLPGFVACTILIGTCTGFYLVPLFTLLQHRAPKTSKGDIVASSNFVNVTGAIAASVLFAGLVAAAKATGFLPLVKVKEGIATGRLEEKQLSHGRPVYLRIGDREIGWRKHADENLLNHLFGEKSTIIPPEIELSRNVAIGDEVIVDYHTLNDVEHFSVRGIQERSHPHYDAQKLPQFLFGGAGLMTFGVLLILMWRVRDLPRRSRSLLRGLFGRKYVISDGHHIPGDLPTILLMPLVDPGLRDMIFSEVDRTVMLFEAAGNNFAVQLEQELIRGRVPAVPADVPLPAINGFPVVTIVRVLVEGHHVRFV
ncbi:MFS transporter [Zavarzinella formosa]|uniref:MFS transporter n=1 Tax=Zavarzinella formosa TaxID=360055 RepID=UPI0002DAB725|nr:MFS transporter [Zavarzinella formosa]